MGSFGVLNACLVVIVLMVLLSQGWLARLRGWVEDRTR